MNSDTLLGKLPVFKNRYVLIEKKQTVYDIIREVLAAHKLFASDYDNIAGDFWTGNLKETCEELFGFCKRNIRYKIEEEQRQTTKSPAAVLYLGFGDCKHYAGFIGGVLDAINRVYGKKIDWRYRFASYRFADKIPEHVFIVVRDNGKEYWIDPV